MSKLLLDESPLIVIPSLAVKVGLNEAIILQQIHYWVRKSKDKWVYNSYKQWQVQFPFFSESTIKRAITNLKKKGILIVEQKSKKDWDRSNHYTIDYEVMDQLNESDCTERKGQIDPDRKGQIDPYNDSNMTHSSYSTETTTETTHKDLLSGKPDVDAVEKSLLDYLNTSAGRNYKPVPSNIRLLKARLAEGHTPQEIAAVIDRKCLEWLNDPKMNQYLRPATLFNAEKFNTYVGQLNSPLPAKHQTRSDHMNGHTHGEKLQEEYRRFLNGHETAEQNNQRILAKNDCDIQPGLVEYDDDLGF